MNPYPPFNVPVLERPVYLRNVRLISDRFLFNNISNVNTFTVVPGVGVGVNTSNPRYTLDVQQGGIIVSSNVGIGTSRPASLLTVCGGVAVGSAYSNVVAPSNSVIVSGNIGIGVTRTSGTTRFAVAGGAAIGAPFSGLTAPTDGLIVASNVGIGTSLPGSRLSVRGGVAIGAFAGLSAPSDGMIISGNLGVGTTLPGSKVSINGGLAVGSAYSNVLAPVDGVVVVGSVGIGITAPGSKVSISGGLGVGSAYATSAAPADGIAVVGSVGIGTLTPGSKLSVSGGASIGSFFASTAAPPDGMIIVGSVGIGTASPGGKLNVNGGVGIGSDYTGVPPPTDGLIVSGSIGIGTTNPGAKVSVSGGVAVGSSYTRVTTPINGLIVEGSTGIGTRAPGAKLSVAGNTAIGLGYSNQAAPVDGLLVLGSIGIGATEVASKLSVSGGVSIGAAYTNVVSPSNGAIIHGSVGIGTANPASKMSVAGGISVGSSYTTYQSPPDGLIVVGNTGIGVTNPASKLSVNGGVSIGSAYINRSAPGNGLIVAGSLGIGTDNPASKVAVNGSVSIGSSYTDVAAPSNSLIVSGNIAVGSSNPLAALHSSGGLYVSGETTLTGNVTACNLRILGSSTTFDSYTVQSSNMIIKNVTGYGPALSVSQSGQGEGYSIADFFDLDKSCNIPCLRIADGGNVGIFTDAPKTSLDVWGSIGVSNVVIIDSNLNVCACNVSACNGFYGQVLTTSQHSIQDLPSVMSIGSNDTTTITGTLTTLHQPNVIFMGLSSNIAIGTDIYSATAKLNVAGNIAVGGINVIDASTNVFSSNVYVKGNIFGSVATSNQQYITSLPSVLSVGSNASTQIIGTVVTPVQTSITSLMATSLGIGTTQPLASSKLDVGGNLAVNGITVIDSNQNIIAKDIYTSGVIFGSIGSASLPNVKYLDSALSVGACNITIVRGTLETALQPNVTSVATNGNLGIGTVSTTAAKVDVWGNIAVNGVTVIDTNQNIYGMIGTPLQSNVTTLPNVLYVGSNSTTTLVGTVNTAIQTGIASLGTTRNIGIGTASAAIGKKLDVWGDVAIKGVTVIDQNQNIYGTIVTGSQPGITQLSNVVYVGSNANTSLVGQVVTPVQTEIASLGLTRNIGIGTSNPSINAKLDVYGNIAVGGSNVIDSAGNITCSNLAVRGTFTAADASFTSIRGEIADGIQTRITRVGNLENLTVGSESSIGGMIVYGNGNITETLSVKRLIVTEGISSAGTTASGGTSFANIEITSNATVRGTLYTSNLIVNGALTTINSIVTETSNVIINNTSGIGPALSVSQSGNGPAYSIADFFDSDVSTVVPALRVANGGNVGINTGTPNATLHVQGDILATRNGTFSSNVTASNVSATLLTGTLLTAPQPNITSVGTLGSLSVNGGISGTLTTSNQSNITSVGTLTSLSVTGGITVDGISNPYVPKMSIDTNYSNDTTRIPASSLLYVVSSNIGRQQFISDADITYTTVPNSGRYNVTCTAYGNAPLYTWRLNKVSDGTNVTATAASPYTFSNVTFTNTNASINALIYTSGSGPGSSVTTCNVTFTAIPQETVGTPFINVSSIQLATGSTLAVDGVNYFTTGNTLRIPVGGATFSNLVGVGAYSGTNFLTDGTSTYSWSTAFTVSPTTSNSVSSTRILSNITAKSSLSFTVSNILGNATYNFNTMFITGLPANPTFTNTNPLVASVSRAYVTGNFTTIDMIYVPSKNVFANSINAATATYLAPTQSANYTTPNQLVIILTPVTGAALVSFGITHNSTVSDIQVQFTTLSATVYSAATSYLQNGCGAGSQTGSTWYIRRPVALSQTAYTTARVTITYNVPINTTVPIPSIL